MDDECDRVLRGGSWFRQPSGARVANRNQDAPVYRSYILGVRLIRVVDSLQQLAEVTIGK